jgi:two-component system, OmpR family, sensor histidine kinase MprB
VSFRARITVVLAVAVSLASVVVALAALQTTRTQIYGELDRALASTARVAVGDQATTAGPGHGGPGVGPRLPQRLRVDDTLVAQVYRDTGATTLLSGPAEVSVAPGVLERAGDGEVTTFMTEVDGVPYRGLARPLGPDAVLVLAADASEQARVLRALLSRFAVIGVAVAGLAALAGWFAAGRLVAPLRRLTAAAEHVSSTGDLSVEVRTEQPDEAGRLSRAFDEMLAALGASQAAQRRLVDDAGHELRTPITSILSNAEVLKRHPDLDPAVREQIADDVILESQELTRLVNALVDLAGVADATEPGQVVDVAALVDDAVRRLPADARARLVVASDPAGVEAWARPDQVRRAVVNLLTNAVKFDPSDSPVEVSVTGADPQWVEVAVRDHGAGFAADDLPHVFARFYRSDSARGTPGSGLGLAIVKDVAQRNGGGVDARNHPDGGAVVRMTLPRAAPDPGRAPAHPSGS